MILHSKMQVDVFRVYLSLLVLNIAVSGFGEDLHEERKDSFLTSVA